VPRTAAQRDHGRDRGERNGEDGQDRRTGREPGAGSRRPPSEAEREPIGRGRRGPRYGRLAHAALRPARQLVGRPEARAACHGPRGEARARSRMRGGCGRDRRSHAPDSGRLDHRRGAGGRRRRSLAARRPVECCLRPGRTRRGGSGRRNRRGRGRRRRRGHRPGDGCGRRARSRRRLRRSGQEEQRVEVALGIGSPAHAEVHRRHLVLRDAAEADGADRLAFAHGRASLHRERAEMQQRHRVPVGRLDRDRSSAGRNRPRERDDPRRRSRHGGA